MKCLFSTSLLSLTLAIMSFNSHSQNKVNLEQFEIDGNNVVYFGKINDENYPLVFMLKNNQGKLKQIDRYEINGSEPEIVTVFFINLSGVENIIVLLSWYQKHQALNIQGEMYQTYGYIYNNGKIESNEKINQDPKLNGLDGEFNGEESFFKYKDASSLRNYLKNKFN